MIPSLLAITFVVLGQAPVAEPRVSGDAEAFVAARGIAVPADGAAATAQTEEAPSAPATSSPGAEGEAPTASSAPSGSTEPGASIAPVDPKVDTSIDQHRSPIDALNERMIGAASRSVRYDWRRSKFGLALIGSELLERNNFGSTRAGLLVRKPFGAFMGELGITRAFTWETDSSEKLALTPYRQYGRPSRFELDVNAGYPLAEGVVTAWPSWFPASEVVFSANAGLRYLFYPGALGGQRFLDVARALVAPRLTDGELEKLEGSRPGGMLIDPARYSLLAGFSLDVYMQPGAFVSPRVMVAVPLLSPVNGTGLGLWWELSLGMGWTF